ncbi:hypothetical protein GCM10012278_20200 [Nonomuraea glycinis]|uniref:Uncharacterized protein n=1 Tax=Nonomuraea glycinis TaxID=2047744 RepID=A0A918A394_9ACTN|nr:hypothetical protein GCM10012278_20200 [Nonomuraea glycinis]
MWENSLCSAVAEDTSASIANFTRGAVRPPVTAYGRTGEAGSEVRGGVGSQPPLFQPLLFQPPLFHLGSVTHITWSEWHVAPRAPPG